MAESKVFVCPEGYKLQKSLDLGNCHATVYIPDLSPEDEKKRMDRIKEATAVFMSEVYQGRAMKEKQSREQGK